MLIPSGKCSFFTNSKFDVVNYGSVQAKADGKMKQSASSGVLSSRQARRRFKEHLSQLVKRRDEAAEHDELSQAIEAELKKGLKRSAGRRKPDDRWTPIVEQKNLNYFVKQGRDKDGIPSRNSALSGSTYMHITDHSLQLARGMHSLKDAIQLDLDERTLALKVNELQNYVKQQVQQEAEDEQLKMKDDKMNKIRARLGIRPSP